jgi:spermidine/putrescine transport system permease protein
MRSSPAIRGFTGLYMLIFFAYLFGPLVIMTVTAFNSSSFPRMAPWECFTFEWFPKLAADKSVLEGLWTTLIIGVGVVFLSVTLGLAGSLLLTQVWPRARAAYYTVITTPILMPGVVLGISTIIFWDRVAQFLGFKYGSFLYNGIFLTILGQSCFISSYCMLVMIARLQRFDNAQIEAALDLGATNVQAFRKVLLPFLRPAILSAAVIAFLASFENYNTTVFTISHYHTFTMAIAQKVRLGLDPSISALAFIIIVLTVVGAIFHEGFSRRGELRLKRALPEGEGLGGAVKRLFWHNPAMVLGSLLVVAIIGSSVLGANYSAESCKADLMREKLERQRQFEEQAKKSLETKGEQAAPVPGTGVKKPGQDAFGNVFDPKNLESTTGTKDEVAPPPPPAPDKGSGLQKPGQSAFGNVFDPKNLKSTTGAGEKPAGQ